MDIRRAIITDKEVIMSLLDSGRQIMRATGNPDQWPEGYPKGKTVEDDICRGDAYLCVDDDRICGTFVFRAGPDDTYARIYEGQWLDDTEDYHVIHRIAKASDVRGVFDCMMAYVRRLSSNIRIDTHRDNVIMHHLLSCHGFVRCGIIHLEDGSLRTAYQWKGDEHH